MIPSHQQIVALNLAICDAFDEQFAVSRPHNLTLIHKQAHQLLKQSPAYRRAHMAYMLAHLKPFYACNQRTALAVLLMGNSLSPETIDLLAGMLKHGSDAKALAAVLEP